MSEISLAHLLGLQSEADGRSSILVKFTDVERFHSSADLNKFRLHLTWLDMQEESNERSFINRMLSLKDLMEEIARPVPQSHARVMFHRQVAPAKWKNSPIIDDYYLFWDRRGEQLTRVKLIIDTFDEVHALCVDSGDFAVKRPILRSRQFTTDHPNLAKLAQMRMFPRLLQEYQRRRITPPGWYL